MGNMAMRALEYEIGREEEYDYTAKSDKTPCHIRLCHLAKGIPELLTMTSLLQMPGT